MKILLCLWCLVVVMCGGVHAQTAAPKPPLSAPADAKLFKGKWYAVVFEKMDWPRAKVKCEAKGGQLAVIPDQETWDFVKALTTSPVWLGATDEKNEGEWIWVDGSKVTFTAWDRDQPDNTGGKQNYLVMWRGSVWQDIEKQWDIYAPMPTVGYVCEWSMK